MKFFTLNYPYELPYRFTILGWDVLRVLQGLYPFSQIFPVFSMLFPDILANALLFGDPFCIGDSFQILFHISCVYELRVTCCARI